MFVIHKSDILRGAKMSSSIKKSLCLIITFALIFLFSSCFYQEPDRGEVALQVSNVDYKSIYREFLINNYSGLEYDEDEDDLRQAKFGLFYVDSDEVPELVISTGGYHNARAELYTIVDNRVKYIGEYGQSGGFQFGEKTGVISSYRFANGGADNYAFYSLENGDTTYLWGGYDKTYINEENRPHKYFIYDSDPNGDSTDHSGYETNKEDFKGQLKKYNDQITTDTTDSFAMYGITSENIDYYFKNFGTQSFEDDLYKKAVDSMQGNFEYNAEKNIVKYYFTDLNNDGHEDVIIQYFDSDPCVAIYADGVFHENYIESEVKLGSLFPSGEDSGLYIDADKGVVIYRYGGHTTGTMLEQGAEAFQISGITVMSDWVLMSNPEKYSSKYPDVADREKAYEECLSDFRQMYNRKNEGLNLVNFFDVCESFE